ncbi:unnamed protein product, partial [Cladocopium goreaui]
PAPRVAVHWWRPRERDMSGRKPCGIFGSQGNTVPSPTSYWSTLRSTRCGGTATAGTTAPRCWAGQGTMGCSGTRSPLEPSPAPCLSGKTPWIGSSLRRPMRWCSDKVPTRCRRLCNGKNLCVWSNGTDVKAVPIGFHSVVVLSCAADACRRQSYWASALQMLLPVLEDRQSADAVCFGSALAACGVGEKWQEAQTFLRRCGAWRLRSDAEQALRRQRAVQPTETLLNILATAIAWDAALHLLAGHHWHLRCDVVSSNVLSKACAQEQQWQLAAQRLRDMRHQGLRGDLVSDNAAMSAFGYGLRWPMVLLQLADDSSWTSNERHSGAAVAACANANSWQSALWLLQTSTFPTDLALRACCAALPSAACAAWQVAWAALGRLGRRGLQVASATMEAVSGAVTRGGQWQVAAQLSELDFSSLEAQPVALWPQMSQLAADDAVEKLQ